MTADDILKRLVNECFFINSSGQVCWKYSSYYEMQNDDPEIAEMIRPYVTEDRRLK